MRRAPVRRNGFTAQCTYGCSGNRLGNCRQGNCWQLPAISDPCFALPRWKVEMEMPGISDPILQSTLGGGNLIRRCPCAQSAWGCCQGSLAPGKQTLPLWVIWMLKYSCSVQGCRCWWHEPGTMPKQNTPRARVGGGRLPAIASGMAIAGNCRQLPTPVFHCHGNLQP